MAQGCEEIETVTPIDVLTRANIQVTTAALGTDTNITASRNTLLRAQTTLEHAVGEEYDALVLPGGGQGAENLHNSPAVSALIEKMHKKGKIIAAICASPAIVLAPLGILDGAKATCFPGMEDNFNATTTYSSQGVVCWKNIVTSAGAGTSMDFALKLVELLKDADTANQIAKQMVYRK